MPNLQRKLFRPTIARDLSLSLVAVIAVVFGAAGTVNYFNSLSRDMGALSEKANEIMDNLASVLVKPLWNIDHVELHKVVDVYRQSGIIADIRLVDDDEHVLVAGSGRHEAAAFELSRAIVFDGRPIGRINVAFSSAAIIAKQREIAIFSALLFATLTMTLILAITLLMRRFLRAPLAELKTGLEVISAGNYRHRFPPPRTQDIADITVKVMLMAGEIAAREATLEQNRHKLEILNQAILDLFSCSDAQSLVRTTLQLAHQVCGVDFGWYLSTDEAIASGEGQMRAPMPHVSIHGKTFVAGEREVLPFLRQEPSDLVHTFELRSRRATIGDMTLAFEKIPDASVTALLRSLVAVAEQAMIRLSLISETALISAELQVAEAVQRSMMPDETRTPARVVVAQHYEPVLRVGGDWFSVIESRGADAVYVILGDVTGHGLAQGLVTTAVTGALQVIESVIHDLDGAAVLTPAQIVTQLNQVIGRIAGRSNLRMTCVAVRLELEERRLRVCNAGHTFPLVLRRNGSTTRLESLSRNQQLIVGDEATRQPGFAYADAQYELGDDDVLVLYTDGLTDAADRQGKAFLRKFQRFFAKMDGRDDPDAIKAALIERLHEHIQDVPVKDDVCLLVVARRPTQATAGAA